MTNQQPTNLADALEAAVRTTQAAAVQNGRALERLVDVRAKFLRELALVLRPALPVLIDRDRWGVELAPGLVLTREGSFARPLRVGERRPELELDATRGVRTLTDAELGAVRIDNPEDLVLEILERVEKHGHGAERATNKLERLRRRFDALAVLLAE